MTSTLRRNISGILGISLPQFWAALMLVMLFSLKLHWLPAFGYGGIQSLILPVVSLALNGISTIARLTRTSMPEVIRSDYVVTATAKGLSRRRVIFVHALPNSIIPVIQSLGTSFGGCLGGAVVIENIFSRLLYGARYSLAIGLLAQVINLLQDLQKEYGLGSVSDARLRGKMAERLAVRAPGADEVLLRVEYVGVCGSDVHYFHAGCCGAFAVDPERDIPYVLGHECAGTVVEVGENVKNLAVGDRVCCEPGVPCGHCEQCRSGHYNLCPDVVFWATPPVQGCYERYVPFRADFCFRLPENVSTRAGALAEPFAIAAGAPVEQVVTHEYALEDIQQAFDDSVNRKNEVVKAIIRI